MQVVYKKDPEYDAYIIWAILHKDDPSGAKNRAENMNIPKKLFNRVYGTQNYNDVRSDLENFVGEGYKSQVNLEDNISLYQKEWDKINDYFSKKIENTINRAWEHDKYYVVVSLYNLGVSSKGFDTVVRSIFEDPKEQRRITAHEILMSNIWSLFYELFPDCEEDPGQHYWALNEITTTAVLGLEPEINKLWVPKNKGYDKYLSNYPQLEELKQSLKQIYINKSNFGSYIDKAKSHIDERYKNKSFAFKKGSPQF